MTTLDYDSLKIACDFLESPTEEGGADRPVEAAWLRAMLTAVRIRREGSDRSPFGDNDWKWEQILLQADALYAMGLRDEGEWLRKKVNTMMRIAFLFANETAARGSVLYEYCIFEQTERILEGWKSQLGKDGYMLRSVASRAEFVSPRLGRITLLLIDDFLFDSTVTVELSTRPSYFHNWFTPVRPIPDDLTVVNRPAKVF